MNKNIKTLGMILVILGIVGIGIVSGDISGPGSVLGYTGLPTTVGSVNPSTPPNYYMQVCCIEQIYMTTTPVDNKYFQLPVTVKILDKNMKPVTNAKINVKINSENKDYVYTPEIWFNSTKNTNVNGIAEFGYSKKWDGSIYDNIEVYVTAKKNKDMLEYRKYIEIVMD
jgi:hypothetical protein